MDKRIEIPSWAYINAQVLQHAHRSHNLSESVSYVEGHYGLSPHSLSIMNPAYFISLLYCLIVVPRELWLKRIPTPRSIADLNKDSVLNLFSIQTKEQKSVFELLRHLRNALAHVRFSIDEHGGFTFWDQKEDQSEIHFKADISLGNMEIFLSSVGAALANLRTELPHIQ